MNLKHIVERLENHGVLFESGLSLIEISNLEKTFNLLFPPDLRDLLLLALPVSKGFVDWKNNTEENINSIRQRLRWPLEGILFDIEHNSFWYKPWGIRPNDINQAKEICETEYLKVPALIPIYSHRYIPSTPLEQGNPIFSVHQTDIIYYGENLEEYLKVEFNDKPYNEINFDNIKEIQFWTDLVG